VLRSQWNSAYTAQQQRFLNKAVIKRLQLQPVVSLLSIADDSEERLLASAIGTATLHMLVCKTEDDLTLLLQQSPPVGLAFVSQEMLNTAGLSSAELSDAADEIEAVFARDCFNEKHSPLLHFLLRDTLMVADVQQARHLHTALKNSSSSGSSNSKTMLPRIIARSGHAVSTAGVTSVLQVDSIADHDGTVMTQLPYFAARIEDTATLHTATTAGQKRKSSSSSSSAGSGSSSGKGKGKGKAKQAKTRH
jgi:SMC proteins Flexible Hinge Domain